jgi:16S rRNA G1207 methylase RsmC
MQLALQLLSSHLRLQPDARVLLLEGDGELALLTAGMVPQGEVCVLARDIRHLAVAQAMLSNTPNAYTGDEVLPAGENTWDAVLIQMPKGRRYGRTLLWSAWSALRPGGQLYVAGATQAGANAFFSDAGRLFGNVQLLGYRKHQRLARSLRGVDLPDPVPQEFLEAGVAPGKLHFVTVIRPEGTLRLATHPGIFSWDALDEGTRLLLDVLCIRPGERVWDVGCGAGVIGLSAALAQAGKVLMTDVNLLAVVYAQRNAELHNLASRVQTRAIDGVVPQNEQWDLLVSNPAFHGERQVDTSMADTLIAQAPSVLAPGGRLCLVANRFLAYEKKMGLYFQHVRRVLDTPQYHVIEAC